MSSLLINLYFKVIFEETFEEQEIRQKWIVCQYPISVSDADDALLMTTNAAELQKMYNRPSS